MSEIKRDKATLVFTVDIGFDRYMDGKWDFAGSGHVDENETATQAVIREAKEEMGILVSVNDVKFAHLSHRIGKNGNRTYYDIYFFIKATHNK